MDGLAAARLPAEELSRCCLPELLPYQGESRTGCRNASHPMAVAGCILDSTYVPQRRAAAFRLRVLRTGVWQSSHEVTEAEPFKMGRRWAAYLNSITWFGTENVKLPGWQRD
jgi:hypothetical protein